MSSSDECDDSNDKVNFCHWNNWNVKHKVVYKNLSTESEKKYVEKNKPMFRRSSVRSSLLSSQKNNQKYGNWIPPNALIFKDLRKTNLCIKKNNPRRMNIVLNNSVNSNCVESSESPCSSNLVTTVSGFHNNTDAKILDWKHMRELSDLNNIGHEDFVWTMIDRGIFSQFKLCYNEYGNIYGSAQGKIQKIGSHCRAFLMVDNPDNLRKLLHVTRSEWSSLCEHIKQTKAVLKYDAYNNVDLSKMNSLEKLFILLCKRRHLLPGMCVSFYLNGAIRLMKEFEIVPKVIVKDFYDMQGNKIL